MGALKIYGFFLAVALALTLPIVWLARKRVRWRWWEVTAYLVPFSVWLWLMSSGKRPKSLANLGELGDLLIAFPLLALIRAALGRRRFADVIAVVGQAALVVVAAVAYFTTPMLPE